MLRSGNPLIGKAALPLLAPDRQRLAPFGTASWVCRVQYWEEHADETTDRNDRLWTSYGTRTGPSMVHYKNERQQQQQRQEQQDKNSNKGKQEATLWEPFKPNKGAKREDWTRRSSGTKAISFFPGNQLTSYRELPRIGIPVFRGHSSLH